MIRLLKSVIRFASARQQIRASEQPFQLFRDPIARTTSRKLWCLKRQIARNSLIGWSFYFETVEAGPRRLGYEASGRRPRDAEGDERGRPAGLQRQALAGDSLTFGGRAR
jgi:hypothetical protein